MENYIPHVEQGEFSLPTKDIYGEYAFAGYCDGVLICLGGFYESVPCWDFWGVFTENFKPIHARAVKKFFQSKFNELPIDRAHHFVEYGSVTGHMMAKFVGADLEGVMKKYYNGKDFAIYAMVK